jgi:hypothetical protein
MEIARADQVDDYQQLCLRLLKAADSPGTYHAASNACIQTAAGYKDRADSENGERRQRDRLLEGGYELAIARAEAHGGDNDLRMTLAKDALKIANAVLGKPLSDSIRADALRLRRSANAELSL